jgi:hypothetical protein
MGLFDWLLAPIQQGGKNIFTQITTPPPTSQAARVFSPTPASAAPTVLAGQSQVSTPATIASQQEQGSILNQKGLSVRFYRAAESVAATIRKGIPIVSQKLQAVPIIGKPLAAVTPYTSESVTRFIETGSMIPGGIEVIGRETVKFVSSGATKFTPGLGMAVAAGVASIPTSAIESAQKEPAQFASDIAVASLLMSRIPIKTTVKDMVAEAPRVEIKPVSPLSQLAVPLRSINVAKENIVRSIKPAEVSSAQITRPTYKPTTEIIPQRITTTPEVISKVTPTSLTIKLETIEKPARRIVTNIRQLGSFKPPEFRSPFSSEPVMPGARLAKGSGGLGEFKSASQRMTEEFFPAPTETQFKVFHRAGTSKPISTFKPSARTSITQIATAPTSEVSGMALSPRQILAAKKSSMSFVGTLTAKTIPKTSRGFEGLGKRWQLTEASARAAEETGQLTKQGQIVLQKQKTIQITKQTEKIIPKEKVIEKAAIKTKLKTSELTKVIERPLLNERIRTMIFTLPRAVVLTMPAARLAEKLKEQEKTKEQLREGLRERTRTRIVEVPKEVVREKTASLTRERLITPVKEKTQTRLLERTKILEKLKVLELTKPITLERFKFPKKSTEQKIRFKGRKGYFGYGEKAAIAAATQILGRK